MKKQDDDPKEPNPNDPKRKIPVKPDKNPDPTKKKPGVNDPDKIDPTRIEEPEKHDPTRIPNPDEDDDNPDKQDTTDTGLFFPFNFY